MYKLSVLVLAFQCLMEYIVIYYNGIQIWLKCYEKLHRDDVNTQEIILEEVYCPINNPLSLPSLHSTIIHKLFGIVFSSTSCYNYLSNLCPLLVMGKEKITTCKGYNLFISVGVVNYFSQRFVDSQ